MPDNEVVRKKREVDDALVEARRLRDDAEALASDAVKRMTHRLAISDLHEIDCNELGAQMDTLREQLVRYQERETFVRALQRLL